MNLSRKIVFNFLYDTTYESISTQTCWIDSLDKLNPCCWSNKWDDISIWYLMNGKFFGILSLGELPLKCKQTQSYHHLELFFEMQYCIIWRRKKRQYCLQGNEKACYRRQKWLECYWLLSTKEGTTPSIQYYGNKTSHCLLKHTFVFFHLTSIHMLKDFT